MKLKMNPGISTSTRAPSSVYSCIPSKALTSSNHNNNHTFSFIPSSLLPPPKFRLRCNSSTSPGGPGENENRTVLDAFFLGKALAEALNERIESTVGEFLSTIGRLQAEQQKQVLDFQEEVLERAKNAKEKAAREAMEIQGLSSSSAASTANISTFTNGVTSVTISSTTDDSPLSSQSSPPPNVVNGDSKQNPIDTAPF